MLLVIKGLVCMAVTVSFCPLPSVPPAPCSPQRLLNWMLALACQRGHLGIVKLLVLTHGADPESYAVRKNEFPVIVRLPLYAAIKSGECGPGEGPSTEALRGLVHRLSGTGAGASWHCLSTAHPRGSPQCSRPLCPIRK